MTTLLRVEGLTLEKTSDAKLCVCGNLLQPGMVACERCISQSLTTPKQNAFGHMSRVDPALARNLAKDQMVLQGAVKDDHKQLQGGTAFAQPVPTVDITDIPVGDYYENASKK